MSRQASRCHQAFSKPCLVNIISKVTHLVFSIYLTAVKRSAEDDGVDDDLEEPDGKRLRLEISEGTDGQHIIQQVQEIQVRPTGS